VTVEAIHEHVANLQRVLLDRLDPRLRATLVPGEGLGDRGHFLTFRLPDAERLHEHLASAGIVTDRRGDRLRIGLGLYHNEDDARQLARRLGAAS
jgi:selenocysteine lyase/cysteine desulfurase